MCRGPLPLFSSRGYSRREKVSRPPTAGQGSAQAAQAGCGGAPAAPLPALPAAQRQRLKALILALPASADGARFFELSGFRGIREIADADLTFADPFNDLTRRGLGLKP